MKKNRRGAQRILALIGIAILVLMYLTNLILALIGSEFTTNLLKATMVMTIAIPIMLYGMLVVMKGADHFLRKPEEELTEEEREGYYRMIAERDEKKYEERRKAKEEKEKAKRG